MIGGMVLGGGIVFDDSLDDLRRRRLRRWAKRHPIETATGPLHLRTLALSSFNIEVLRHHPYGGRVTLVGVDLGRTLGLHSERHWPARKGGWADGWGLGLRGWGVWVRSRRDGRWRWRANTGFPLAIRVAAVGVHGTKAGFDRARQSQKYEAEVRAGVLPADRTAGMRGEWDRTPAGTRRPYSGRFVDVLSAAFALDGCDSGDLDDHLVAWGLKPVGAPFAVSVDSEGAEVITRLVNAIHALTMVVDDEAARWVGGLDLRWLSSPGTTASQVLGRMGVEAPLAKFHLPDAELAAWTAALHGGWVEVARGSSNEGGAVSGIAGRPFPGGDVDVRSAYPAVAALVGWWDHMAASRVRRRPATRVLRRFLASPDLPEAMLDAATWRRWGLTRVVVRACGEPMPVELPGENGGPSRLVVKPVWAERYEVTWLDAVAATLLAGHPIEVVAAVQLVPDGHQEGLRPARVPGGLLRPDCDPIPTLARLRRRAKAPGDLRIADLLRVLMNALVYGNLARFDPDDDGERPGPWCWPPLAASVAAGCRCLLAMAEAGVRARGSVIAYRDTDGAIIPCSAEGGWLGSDEDRLRILPRAEPDALLAGFDQLDPFGDGEPFWQVEAEGTVVVWGPKRYVVLDSAGGSVLHTEHVLGGYVSPPGTSGRDEHGRHHWTAEVAKTLADVAVDHVDDGLVPTFAWEGGVGGFPALDRVSLSSPDALAAMPLALGFRPFARIVEAIATFGDAHPVAPDPGGDLADWARLAWFDARTAEPIRVVTDPQDLGLPGTRSVLVETLRARAIAWARPNGRSEPAGIRVDPLLSRTTGRAGGAFVDGTPQPVHRGIDTAAALLHVPTSSDRRGSRI
ncbi:MAG: hypothetical protein ACYDAD_13765 [Acidimicrobiales bacterium]